MPAGIPPAASSATQVVVTAAIFADGHDQLAAHLLYRRVNERKWRFTPMSPVNNDIWTGSFPVDKIGGWQFTVVGWVDHFVTWESELRKRLAAQVNPALPRRSGDSNPLVGAGLNVGATVGDQNIPLALRSGAILLKQGSQRARGGRRQAAARGVEEPGGPRRAQ